MEALPLEWRVLAQVAIAMVAGGMIGAEREKADKPAGFRTHTLVAGAACLLVGLSEALINDYTVEQFGEAVRTDPVRVVEAIVTGIAFLGAGTIFRSSDGDHVEGLTTAASILMVAAIGICCALSLYWLTAGMTALTLIVLWVIDRIQKAAD